MAERGSTGAFDPSEIEEYVIEAGGPPTEAGASLTARFSRRVSDLVVRRVSKGEKGCVTVFLRSESLVEDSRRCVTVESPLLAHGEESLSGRIWLSTASLNAAFEVRLEWNSVQSLYEAIRRSGFGKTPALVIDWRLPHPTGRLYRKGLDDPEDAEPIYFEEAPIAAAAMKEVLDRFYERSLRTPSLASEGHARKVWKSATQGIPEHRPEEIIQGRLLDVLKTIFLRHEVRAEPVTSDGRADIIVYSKSLTQSNRPAIIYEWVLELKALCDKTNTGNNIPKSKLLAAVNSGLEQVVAYRKQLNGENAALCCYDMQACDQGDSSCFDTVQEDAKHSDVSLWRWYLFRSTSASRAAKRLLSSQV